MVYDIIFACRSTEHFHCVLRVLDGLSVDTIHAAFRLSNFEVVNSKEDAFENLAAEEQAAAMADHEAVEEQRRVAEKFSSLRLGETALHPEPDPQQWPPPQGPNRERPQVNCLRRLFSEVGDDPEKLLQDIIFLTNRVQRHKCTRNYCLKSIQGLDIPLCKFHYPIEEEGFEADTEGELVKHITNKLEELSHPGARFCFNSLKVMRNHSRVVQHIPEIMLAWRANTNLQIVRSIKQLLDYVVKYMLKPSTGSKSFNNTVKDITEQQGSDTRAASIYQKVLMRQLSEHDMPRTEAFRIVSGLPFVFYSREFRNVNLLGVRRVSTDSAPEQATDRRATQDNFADIYWVRESRQDFLDLVQLYEDGKLVLPWHPRQVSLYNFVAYFDKRWRLTGKTYVPHISPTFRYSYCHFFKYLSFDHFFTYLSFDHFFKYLSFDHFFQYLPFDHFIIYLFFGHFQVFLL